MDMGNIVPRRRLRRERVPSAEPGCSADSNDAQECRPAKGQLVSSLRSKPLSSADENATLDNIDSNNSSLKPRQPTAKEVAAAKAARIRLGYEQAGDEAGTDELAAPKLPDGPEPPRPEDVDYVPLSAAIPCDDVDGCLKDVKDGLQNPSWLLVCKALASLQQLTAHHQDALASHLNIIAPLMVKHVQSLRSQVSKVAILCYGDLVQVFGDKMLPHVDGKSVPPKPSESALAQLLLKSVSKDKKFVLEASQKVLESCAHTLEPVEMSHKLIGYLKHKNPNVRGAACEALWQSVERLQPDYRQVEELARSGLLQSVAGLLSDKAPAARAHSRKIVCVVKEAVGHTSTSSKADAAELASEPSSDQENTITGNVSAAKSAAPGELDSKSAHPSSLAPTVSGNASAWTSLCNEILSPTELLNVNRLSL